MPRPSWPLTGKSTRVVFSIDTNHNGSFTDAVDVQLAPVPGTLGSVATTWDGLDGQGNAVPGSQTITVRASAIGIDELHFTTDVERLTGGMQVEKIIGATPGSRLMSWDDSKLSKRDHDAPPSDLTGNLVDTSTSVRAYGQSGEFRLNYGWGDGRHLDSWMSDISDVSASATIAGVSATSTSASTSSSSTSSPTTSSSSAPATPSTTTAPSTSAAVPSLSATPSSASAGPLARTGVAIR